jgi:hypothetical protein
MFYIDGPGATVDHKFTDGDPAAGVAATTVTDDWANDVQQEILNVITAAGIVPAKGIQDQLLKAIRGAGAAGLFATPPQFDNTTKAATTAFVQRALGSWANVAVYGVNTSLTPADIGKLVVTNAANLTFNLPFADGSVPDGAMITINNTGGGFCNVNPQGGNVLSKLGGTPISPLNIQQGAIAEFHKHGNTWVLTGGDVSLQYSPFFASLKGGPGWFKLPSGFIVEFGSFTTTASGGGTVTWPLAFPGSPLGFAAIGSGGSSTNFSITVGPVTKTTGDFFTCSGNPGTPGIAQAGAFQYIVIGV